MPADVQIHEMTGVGVGVDKTSDTVRFKAADNTSVDTNDKLLVLESGTTYSYTKQLQCYVNVAPETDIEDLEAYSDGGNGFGAGVEVQYDVQAAFTTNVNTDIAGADLFTKNSNDPIDLDANNAGPHTGTGYKGDLLRLQMSVADTAEEGAALSAESLTFAYLES